MFLWEAAITQGLKKRLSPIAARPALKQVILEHLGHENKKKAWGRSYPPQGWATVLALILLIMEPYLLWLGHAEEDLFGDAIIQYQRVSLGIADNTEKDSPVTLHK